MDESAYWEKIAQHQENRMKRSRVLFELNNDSFINKVYWANMLTITV